MRKGVDKDSSAKRYWPGNGVVVLRLECGKPF